MSTTTDTPNAPKATLTKETALLFHIAASSHTLAELFGVEDKPLDDLHPLKFYAVARSWLTPHPVRRTEYTFDADLFAQKLNTGCSDGQRFMILFILNVWNPAYARRQGWQFDLFTALNTLDEQNRVAIAQWMEHPVWP